MMTAYIDGGSRGNPGPAGFAHRGLHGAGASENGMAAFNAAIAQGYGAECDVRLSRDGVAMVFHDAALSRVTGVEGVVAGRTAAQR